MANIIVIGGSAAGMSFAAKYKRNCPGDNILVFEKNEYISFGACGLPYFLQNQFDDKNALFARTPSQMIDSGIDVRPSSIVTAIDGERKFVVVDGQKYKYDKLVIATGARPQTLELAAVDNKRVFTLTNLENGISLKEKLNSGIKHLTIIGGGFIGMEVLDAAAHLNISVTLLEQGETILSQSYDGNMSSIVVDEIGKYENLQVMLNCTCTDIDIDEQIEVTTTNGNFTTDAIVYSLGFIPCSELLNCNKLDNGAILVDVNGQTSIEDIYAIGDVATTINLVTNEPMYLPLATNANKFGKSLADHLSGMPTNFKGMVGTSCIKILDYDMASTGLTSKQLTALGIEFKEKTIVDKTHTHYYHGAEDIHIKLLYCPDSLKIYGGQIVGTKDVVGRINPLALGISLGITTEQLGYVDFAYAPPFARTWEALNVAGNVSR